MLICLSQTEHRIDHVQLALLVLLPAERPVLASSLACSTFMSQQNGCSCNANGESCLPILRHRRAEEARHAAIIAEERRKLLEQAAELAEYLPPGVVKDRQELEFLKQTAQLRQQQNSNSFGRTQ